MIKLLLIFIAAFLLREAESCEMSIPLSYAPTFLNPPVSGHYMKCEAKPEEQCLCIDGIEPWYAELVDEQDESGNVIGKKLINSGPKRDAYLAAKAAEKAQQEADEQDKKLGCSDLKGVGALIDSIEANIPNGVSTVSNLRQEVNKKFQDVADVLKKVRRCLK